MTSQNQTLPPPSRPQEPIWGAGPTIGFGIVILVGFLLIQGLVAFIFAINRLFAQPSIDPGQLVGSLATDGFLLSTAVIASAIGGVSLIFLFIKLRHGWNFARYLGLRPLSRKSMLIVVGVVLGLLLASTGLDQIIPNPQGAEYEISAYRTAVIPALFWLAIVVFAPVFEESFFRGFVFVGLEQSRIGPVGAIIITAVAWALLHIQYNLYGMSTILILGIVLGIVRYRTGSLWSTVIMHAIWNLAAVIGLALQAG